jgi:hypothetical protein
LTIDIPDICKSTKSGTAAARHESEVKAAKSVNRSFILKSSTRHFAVQQQLTAVTVAKPDADSYAAQLVAHVFNTLQTQTRCSFSTLLPMPSLASRGTLLTALGDTSKMPVVPTVSSAPVANVCASTASASSAPASPASFLQQQQQLKDTSGVPGVVMRSRPVCMRLNSKRKLCSCKSCIFPATAAATARDKQH